MPGRPFNELLQVDAERFRQTRLDQHDVGACLMGALDIRRIRVRGDDDNRHRRRGRLTFETFAEFEAVDDRQPCFRHDD